MKELLQTILEPMLDYPDALNIEVHETKHHTTLKVNVHDDDMGRVIGKRGRVIKAVRTVMSNANLTNTKKVFVELD